MAINKIPKSETGYNKWITTAKKGEYVVTHNKEKGKYTLWKILNKSTKNEQYDKISTADTPLKLYDKIEQLEKSL